MSVLQQAIEKLAAAWLGRDGVAAVCDENRNGSIVIVVQVAGEQNPCLPKTFSGYKVVIERGNSYAAEAT